MSPLPPSSTTLPQFNEILSRYAAAITSASRPKPETLESLDLWRRTELPATITARSPPHITKPELYRLVDCKLKRGKNRPILGLIESNAADAVVSTTTKAFAEPDIRSSFSHLLALRGVGPATATYILAAFRPTEAPVFSDEAFRWIVHGGAWGTKIKYSAKEYWEYFEGVEQLAKQLGVGGEDIEKVGFVLGKEAVETAPVKGKTPARKEKESKIATGGIASNKRKAAVQHKQEDGADDDKKPRPGKKQKPLDPDTPKMAAPGRVLRSRTAAAKK